MICSAILCEKCYFYEMSLNSKTIRVFIACIALKHFLKALLEGKYNIALFFSNKLSIVDICNSSAVLECLPVYVVKSNSKLCVKTGYKVHALMPHNATTTLRNMYESIVTKITVLLRNQCKNTVIQDQHLLLCLCTTNGKVTAINHKNIENSLC